MNHRLKILFKVFIIVLFTFIAFSSCKKIKQNRLEGTWNLVSVSENEKYLERSWIFKDDNSIIIKTINNNTLVTDYDTGIYKISIQSFKTYIDILDVNLWDSGKFFVDKLSGKYLFLLQQTDGHGANVYVRKEFTKND